MRINDIVLPDDTFSGLCTIKQTCNQFLRESDNNPLHKNLPVAHTDFQKIKVRKKKHNTGFSDTFNYAFENQHNELRQRAIFAHGTPSFVAESAVDVEPFYIFPIDGFRYLYSPDVNNSSDNYKKVFETISDSFGESEGTEMLADLLRLTYVSNCLAEGITTGSEIIIYDIPFFYAVRETCTESYEDLLDTMDEIR